MVSRAVSGNAADKFFVEVASQSRAGRPNDVLLVVSVLDLGQTDLPAHKHFWTQPCGSCKACDRKPKMEQNTCEVHVDLRVPMHQINSFQNCLEEDQLLGTGAV